MWNKVWKRKLSSPYCTYYVSKEAGFPRTWNKFQEIEEIEFELLK